MTIELFSICDAATHGAGKLNLLGAFDTIRSKAEPVKFPHCAIALRIRFENSEAGNHQLRIVLIDEDGKQAGPQLDGTVNVVAVASAPSQAVDMILGMNNPVFPKFGEYTIDLVVDGSLKARLPLFVKAVPEKPKAA